MKHEAAPTPVRVSETEEVEVEGYTIFRVNVDTDPAEVVPRPLTPAELPAARSRPIIFWA